MKDEIENITKVMKEVARIRDKFEQKYPTSSTGDYFRRVESDLSEIRELLDFDPNAQ